VDFTPNKNDLLPDIEKLSKCTEFIKTDKRIERILEIILHTGNFMNAGNSRLGSAMGFQLETLTKLHDTKTADNKQSIFEILVEMIKDQQPELISFSKTESEIIDDGSRVSLQTVESELNKLVKEFEVVCNLAPTIKTVDDEDLFQKRFGEFIIKAKGELTDLQNIFKEANDSYISVVVLFGEDPKIMGPEEFFVIWKTFIGKIIETNEKLTVDKINKEKEKKREEQKLKREQELANKALQKTGGSTGDEGGEGEGGGRGGATRGGRRGRGGRDPGGGRGRGATNSPNVQELFSKLS